MWQSSCQLCLGASAEPAIQSGVFELLTELGECYGLGAQDQTTSPVARAVGFRRGSAVW